MTGSIRHRITRVVIGAILASFIYPIAAVWVPQLLPEAKAAYAATAVSVSGTGFWTDPLFTGTPITSTQITADGWISLNSKLGSLDDGYTEIDSPGQTCVSASYCTTLASSFSFSYLGTTYNKVFIGTNGYILFNGSDTAYSVPTISTIPYTGIALCSGDRVVKNLYYRVDSSGNLHIRDEFVDFSNQSANEQFYEVTLINGTNTFDVALGSFAPTYYVCSQPVSSPTAANTSAGLFYDTTPGSGAPTLVQTFPTGATALTNTQTQFTTSNGPVITSSVGTTLNADRGTALIDTLTTTGGAGTTTLSMNTANPGVSFNATTGVLTINSSATPGTNFTQTFTATDSNNATSTLTITININAPPTASAASSTVTNEPGVAATDVVTISNGTAPNTFTLASSLSQAGITLTNTTTTATLNIATTGVAAGTYYETITSTDADGVQTATPITVIEKPTLTLTGSSGSSINTSTGVAAQETITANNGIAPYTFSIAQGTPSSAGITLDVSTASSGYVRVNIASNVPANTYVETVTATDSKSISTTFRITTTVNPAVVESIVSNTINTTQGLAAVDTVTATGGTGGKTFSISGLTPANSGITSSSLVSSPLTINVASTVPAGTYYETVTATDTLGVSASQSLTINVNPQLRFTNTNGTSVTTTAGVAKTLTLTTTGGTAPDTFTVTSSPVNPSGITLGASTGIFTVSNSVPANTYYETVTATDAVGATAVSYVTITVNPAIVVTGSNSLVTTAGIPLGPISYTSAPGTGVETFTATNVNGITFTPTGSGSATLGFASSLTATNATTPATYVETLTATDSVGATKNYPVTLTVNPAIIITASNGAPQLTTGNSLIDTITATQGTGSKTFTINTSTPSSGITFINGVTNQGFINVSSTVSPGTYYETITATDTATATTSYVLTIVVNSPLNVAATGNATTLATTTGKAASLQITAANGTGNKTFAFSPNPANAGITLNTSTASLGYATLNVGTGVAAGTYIETITATDANSNSANTVITVTVNALPTLTGPSTLTTTAGTALTSSAFTEALGTGTSPTYTLSNTSYGITVNSGSPQAPTLTLPTTLTATSSTVANTFTETLTATDAAGASAAKLVSIIVNPAIIVAATQSSLSLTSGGSTTDTITATQGTGTKTFSITSSAVPGITLAAGVANQAILTVANSTSPASYSVVITATDAVGSTTSTTIAITIANPISISGPATISATQGVTLPISPLYTASYGIAPYTFNLTSYPTASGITLTSSGSTAYISVASSVSANTYTETIKVTDNTGVYSTFTTTLVVAAPVTLTGTMTLNATYGSHTTSGYTTSGGTAPYTFSGSSTSSSSVVSSCASTISTVGANTVEQIFGTGTCNWITPNSVSTAQVLVVGGGGGGAGNYTGYLASSMGGGGGGGVYPAASVPVSGSIAVVVGAGGAGGTASATQGNTTGNQGGTSSFSTISAGGGGGGGCNTNAPAGSCPTPNTQHGLDGTASGSGGGGSNAWAAYTYGPAGNASSTTVGGVTFPGISGYQGGVYIAGTSGTGTSASGGGAGGAGSYNAPGAGVSSSITGSSVTYGSGGGAYGATGYSYSASTSGYGNGGTGAPANPSTGVNGGKGAPGLVAIRYATPATLATNIITVNVNQATPSGILTVNIPATVPAGNYIESVNVIDANGSSTASTINIVVAKATPTVTLALPGGATTLTYGSPVTISATVGAAGTVAFKDGTTTINGCGSVIVSGSLATCSWTPSVGSHTIYASFTPNDASDYNTASATGLAVTVNQAPTLTITANSPAAVTYGTGFSIANGFTTSGLASIDTITGVTYTYSGTANDASNYSSTTAPTKAGTYAITPSAAVFNPGSASNYTSVVYAAGSLTVNRANNSSSLRYPNNNIISYAPGAVDTPTATSLGDGVKSFSTTSSTYCSVDPNTGLLTVLQPGTCAVSMQVSQGANYLSDSASANVTINYGTRTITLSAGTLTLKYGDTTTVTTTISAGANDGTVSYSTGSSTGCSFNGSSGIITATSGSGTCTLVASISQGTYYQQVTSANLTFSIALANAPVVTVNPIASTAYNSGITPTLGFSVSGLKFSDTAASVTYYFAGTGTTSYGSSTTIPTSGGSYSVTPANLALGTGSLSNYNSPSYISTTWTITQIAQAPLSITNFYTPTAVPFTLLTSGGSSTGAITFTVVPGGTASDCSITGAVLISTTGGTCNVYATQAADANYLAVTSPTVTISILNFTSPNYVSVPQSSGGAIVINAPTPVVTQVGNADNAASCHSGCAPTITGITDNGLPATAVRAGDQLVITGSGFAAAPTVIVTFNRVPNQLVQVDSDTQITVQVPAGQLVGPLRIYVQVGVTPNIASQNFSGLTVVP